jgi:hypothetical protein
MLKQVEFEYVPVTEEDETNQTPDDDKKKEFGDWLKSAEKLKVYRTDYQPVKVIVDVLYQEITSTAGKKFKSPTAVKQTIETTILNLYRAFILRHPIRYSRSKNYYSRKKKFGRWSMSYALVIAVTDALEALEYLEQAIGRSFYEDRTRGSQTRMWATQKLFDLFHDHQIGTPDFIIEAEQDLIQLRDTIKTKTSSGTIKQKVYYRFVRDRRIQQMEKDMEKYKEILFNSNINLILNHSNTINYRFLYDISKYFYTNRLTIVSLIPSLYYYLLQYYYNTSIPIYTYMPDTHVIPPLPHITRTNGCEVNTDKLLDDISEFIIFVMKKQKAHYQNIRLARYLDDKSLETEINAEVRNEFALKNIGIETINLRLNREYIHRVFSRKSFDKGGRFYGPLYQQFPANTRRHLFIDNEPTVELDYKSLHIRMLYHLKSLSYEADPYTACAGGEYKKLFKTALLVSINATDESSAQKAIRKQLIEKGIPLDYPLDQIIPTIKKTHCHRQNKTTSIPPG